MLINSSWRNWCNYYCGECKIYICNKCEKFHSILLKNHQIINFENNNEEIFSGFCSEKGHQNKLEYFCNIHNKLCCIICISSSKFNIGIHNNCNVCLLKDIKNEKRKRIKDNIIYFEDFFNNINKSIKVLNEKYEKIKKEKEELKMTIQNIFTNKKWIKK